MTVPSEFRVPKLIFLLVNLLYACATPPFQVRDEDSHFYKAYQLSEGRIFAILHDGELGDYLPTSISSLSRIDFPTGILGVAPQYSLDVLVAAWNRPSAEADRKFTAFSNIAIYSPSLYIPQAAGIAAARGLGLPPLGQFYAARLLNALVGTSLVLAAISLMPVGRNAMLAVASFPMVSYQIGSLSADAGIIGLSFFVTAYVLHEAENRPFHRWSWQLPPLLSLLALAKGVYLPLALAAMSVRRPGRKWRLISLAFHLTLALAIAGIWAKLNTHSMVRQHFVSRKTLQRMVAALPGEQLAYIIDHPFRYAQTLVTSVIERAPVYVFDCIGRFGWFSLMLPVPLYVLAIVAIFLALITPVAAGANPKPIDRLLCAAIIVCGVILVETALYLIASPLGANYIEAVQGRYYIPYLPLLGIAFAMPLAAETELGRYSARTLPFATVTLMAAGVAFDVKSFWAFKFAP